MEFVRDDFIPRMQDAGLDAVIEALVVTRLTLEELVAGINQTTGWAVTADMVRLYIADRWAAAELLTIQHIDGSMPGGVWRAAAPTGLGAAEWGVWFSSPDSGTAVVRWYVNGTLKLQRSQDLTSNRSATLPELGAQAGDVVQVGLLADSGAAGWWGRTIL